MSYVAQARNPNPAALLGALGVPAAFGALLITGLAVTAAIQDEDKDLIGVFVDTPPPPKPKPIPEPVEIPKPQPQQQSVITAPKSPIDLTNSTPVAPTNPLPPTPLPPATNPGTGMGTGTGPAIPKPSPSPRLFDPVAASPRGNPGGWVTTSDYRTSWIRREMTGSASFNLQISASGRVTGCTITSSTGHNALDQATCRLLQKRAKFDPARDNTGAKVASTYRNSISWRLPE